MGTDAKDNIRYHCEKKSHVRNAQPDLEKQLKEIMSALQATATTQNYKSSAGVQAGGSGQNVGRSDIEQKRCYNCGKTGHFRRQCWQRFQQPGRDCFGQGTNDSNGNKLSGVLGLTRGGTNPLQNSIDDRKSYNKLQSE